MSKPTLKDSKKLSVSASCFKYFQAGECEQNGASGSKRTGRARVRKKRAGDKQRPAAKSSSEARLEHSRVKECRRVQIQQWLGVRGLVIILKLISG